MSNLKNSFCYHVLVEVGMFLCFHFFIILSTFVCIMDLFLHLYKKTKQKMRFLLENWKGNLAKVPVQECQKSAISNDRQGTQECSILTITRILKMSLFVAQQI